MEKHTEPIHKNTFLEDLKKAFESKNGTFLDLPALRNTWRNAKRCWIQE